MSIVVAVRKNNSIVMAADTLTCFSDDERVPAENCTRDPPDRRHQRCEVCRTHIRRSADFIKIILANV